MAKITVVEMRGFLERAQEAGRRVELEEDEKIDRGHLRSFTANGQACGLSAGVKFRAHPDTVAMIVDEDYDDSPKEGVPADRGADWPPRSGQTDEEREAEERRQMIATAKEYAIDIDESVSNDDLRRQLYAWQREQSASDPVPSASDGANSEVTTDA